MRLAITGANNRASSNFRYRRTIRVLQTPPRYPPYTGGVENVARSLAQGLAAIGEHVLVVCADEPRQSPGADGRVLVRRLRWRMKLANTNITPCLPIALMRERWDVVETHIPTPWSADWSMIVARLLGRGSVLSFYNMIVGQGWSRPIAWLYRHSFFRLSLRLADRVIVVSEPWRQYLADVEPSVQQKVKVIPTGVDVERFRPVDHQTRSYLLFVGVLDRFHRYKGLEVLLQALSEIKQDFNLIVVGEGELRPEYEALASELGLGTHVRFVGHVTDHELIDIYGGSIAYILPSTDKRREAGFTLTALEAMSSGVPVVIAEGAGAIAREVEHVGAGFCVPSGNPVAMRLAIEKLLIDTDTRSRMSERARRYVVDNLSWEVIVRSHLKVYEDAVNEAVARRKYFRRRIHTANDSSAA